MAKKINYQKLKSKYFNTLFFKLALTSVIGSVCLALCLFSLNMKISRDIFVDVFSDSQTKIFNQIENVFYQFYVDVAQITAAVENSEKLTAFLTMEQGSTAEELGLIYAMQKQVNQMKIKEYDNLTLLIAGLNGKSYMCGRAERLSSSLAEIEAMTFTQKARERKGELICEYVPNGFTDSAQNEPVIVWCRTIQNKEDGAVIGYTYLIMKEADMRKQYDYFVSGTGDIIVLNQDNEVISTNNSIYLELNNEPGMEPEALVHKAGQTGLIRQFSNTNLTIVGLLNPAEAFFVRYDLVLNILLVALITALIISVIFILVRRQTRPLYKLANAMQSQKNGISNNLIELEGTKEIKELSQTYNEMIADLNHYIQRVMETEKAKRQAELHALQMQINPHYIYNTLASIKWLILQGNTIEATEALDAFIALLRNTISNVEEFIPFRQEIENIKNYVLINQKRYGDKVQVEFYLQEDCKDCMLPKLILQPFIENAFFHAFPQERRGRIRVFAHKSGGQLLIEITDDGIGMEPAQVDKMLTRQEEREHFTGIGIKNVDERIKIIYGAEYGLHIESAKESGTSITIKLPI